MNDSPNQTNRSDGIPFPIVAAGALVILGVLVYAFYIILTELNKVEASKSTELAAEQSTQSTPVPNTSTQLVKAATPAPTSATAQTKSNVTSTVTNSPQTFDIGAYLTYGGKASSLNRAVARLSADNRRLIVGLFEATQGPKEQPALGMLFDFKEVQTSCSLANLKEVTLLFNLKAMGNIAAQTTELTLRTQSEFQQSIMNFSCALKKGGRLDLHLLGSEPKLIKPPGSTFAWGLRLAQEIG